MLPDGNSVVWPNQTNTSEINPMKSLLYSLLARSVGTPGIVVGKGLQVAGKGIAVAGAATHDAGIVDLVSFAVLRRLGITQVFTNDKHFTAAGFEVLF